MVSRKLARAVVNSDAVSAVCVLVFAIVSNPSPHAGSAESVCSSFFRSACAECCAGESGVARHVRSIDTTRLPQRSISGCRSGFHPIWDRGVVQGATVTEMIRTFRGVPFRLCDHLSRLRNSLAYLG